ncbi:MAG TPA: hypothetical protein VK178_06970 [Opitutaceae bacterium]|nr:hypothetical protein [Opitutaceae bacterium]
MDSSPTNTNSAKLAPFLRALADTGDVTIAKWEKLDGSIDDTGAEAILRELHAAASVGLSGEAPPFDSPSAHWAARQLYRACQMLVCRDVSAEEITAGLSTPCPSPRAPAVDYSVDLTFRHLPELHTIAHRLSPGDRLVGLLRDWAQTWPLSSPGIPVESAPDLGTFADHAPLWRLYLDRIALRQADDRLRDERVRAALAADFGAHPDLSPALHSALERSRSLAPASSP